MKNKDSRLSDNVEDHRGAKGSKYRPGTPGATKGRIYEFNKEDMISNPNLREKERVGNWGNASKEPFKGDARTRGVGFKDNTRETKRDPSPQKGFFKHTIKGLQ